MIGAAVSCVVLLGLVFVPMAFVCRVEIRAWWHEIIGDTR